MAYLNTTSNLDDAVTKHKDRIAGIFQIFLVIASVALTSVRLPSPLFCLITIRWRKRHTSGRKTGFPTGQKNDVSSSNKKLSLIYPHPVSSLLPLTMHPSFPGAFLKAPLQIISLCWTGWLHDRGAILQLSTGLEEHTVHAHCTLTPSSKCQHKNRDSATYITHKHTVTAATPWGVPGEVHSPPKNSPLGFQGLFKLYIFL